MISVATGAMALVMVTLVKDHGLQYLLSATVLTGVLLSGIFFAHKVGRLLRVDSTLEATTGQRIYTVSGQVFFALAEVFDFKKIVPSVRIDVSAAHFWDITSVAVLDKAVMNFRRADVVVELRGLNEVSATLVDRFAVHDKPGVARPVH